MHFLEVFKVKSALPYCTEMHQNFCKIYMVKCYLEFAIESRTVQEMVNWSGCRAGRDQSLTQGHSLCTLWEQNGHRIFKRESVDDGRRTGVQAHGAVRDQRDIGRVQQAESSTNRKEQGAGMRLTVPEHSITWANIMSSPVNPCP